MNIPMAGALFALDNPETWVAVAFLLFVAVLLYVGVPRLISKMLDDRAAGIRKQITEARNLREEAQRKLADAERSLKEAEAQGRDIIAQAQADAETLREQSVTEIQAQVQRHEQAAMQRIARAESEALRSVHNATVEAVIGAATDMLKADPAIAQNTTQNAVAEVVQHM